jgi:hypothetical protein
MTPLAGWENFYVIVGSSAGALIGLQFVVITLIADLPIVRGQPEAGEAFATPTVVHFGAALFLAAAVSAPWKSVAGAAVAWGLIGLSGIFYQIVVARKMRTQTVYAPVFEDWMFHMLLPVLAYGTLAAAAVAVRRHSSGALFVVAGAALLLLLIGIHNAWDAVTYNVFVHKRTYQQKERPRPAVRSGEAKESQRPGKQI